MADAPGRALPLVALVMASCGNPQPASPCARDLPYVHVDTARRLLWLCEPDHRARAFPVRLGRGGVGKRAEGDGKVPIGTYALGAPRRSGRFGLFVSVGYPTQAQREQGLTGSAIGIHGPHRFLTWLGVLNNGFDTTEGCIGLATDDDMSTVAHWIEKQQASVAVIE